MENSNAAPQAKNGVLRITWENIATEVYMPRPGIEYEVADGCVRRLKRPFYDVVVRASVLAKQENVEDLDPQSDAYGPTVRMKILSIVTEGDPLPKDGAGIDMGVAGRAVIDFFTLPTLLATQRAV